MPYRPLQLTRVVYPLMGGVDTKIHGHVLPAPKLQTCENAYVEQTGSIRRRPGRSLLSRTIVDGTSLADMTAFGTYKGNLLGFTIDGSGSAIGGKGYEYSESLLRWVSKGSVESFRVRTQNVAQEQISQGDSGTANGVTVVAYTATAGLKITLLDANGTVLKQPYVVSATGLYPRVVVRANIAYAFYWESSTNAVRVVIFDCATATSLGTMSPSPVTVATTDATYPQYDVSPNTSYGVFLAYNDTTASRITFGFVDTSGVLASTSTAATVTNDIRRLSVDVAPGNAMHGIFYATGQGVANDCYALHRSYNGAAWTATATSGAIQTGISVGSAVQDVTCKYLSATTLYVYYQMNDASSGTTQIYVRLASYTTGGTTTQLRNFMRSYIISDPARADDGLIYLWLQGVGHDVNLLYRHDGVVMAKAVEQGPYPAAPQDVGWLANLDLASGSMTMAQVYLGGAGAASGSPLDLASLRRVIVDTAHASSYAAAEYNEELFLAGGFLQAYDGDAFVENNFLTPYHSDFITDLPTTTAGTHLTLLADYSYMFIPESIDKRGNRSLGTNFGVYSPNTLTGTENKITFTIPSVPDTRKSNVVIGVYRTTANPTEDTPHYRIGQVANNTAVDSLTYVDTAADVDIVDNETFYQDAGELENTAPPAGHLLAFGNGRVLIAGFADLPNKVMASKEFIPGRELSFSDFLPSIDFPETGGPVTAIAVMNGFVVGFKEGQIYRAGGDGPNNTGFGGFSQPELVSADTGTLSPRSVVVTPMGIFFEGAKGKMLLTQSFQVVYIGAPLEKLTDPGECVGASLLPTLQQVRFTYTSTTHVFDYYHQQWYVFTHGSEGLPAVWNDTLVAITGAVPVYGVATVWDDAGEDYAVTLTLGWAHGESLHADSMVRKIGLTGESLAAHNLAITIAYDYNTTGAQFIDEVVAAAGVLRRDHRLNRRVDAGVQITIRDAFLNIYGEYDVLSTAGFRLNELVFELGSRSQMIGR